MRLFYEGYSTKDMSLLQNHFWFTAGDWDQVELFHSYLDELIEHFLQQNSTYGYDVIAMSELMAKNMNATVGYLARTLPITVASRVTAINIANDDSATCESFFTQAGVGLTEEQAEANCVDVDLSDPNQVRDWMNATWYKNDPQYMNDFAEKYGLDAKTSAQYFFFPMPGYFGYYVSAACAEIAV